MTLSTNIYVLDETGPHELFRHCQTLLTEHDEQGRTWRQQACSDEPMKYTPGAWSISNQIGQGLPAILDIEYRPGAPLWTPEQAAECDDDCSEDCGGDHYVRACWLNIDFDTSYGYDHNGMKCGDLHAVLVAQVGQWLDKRGLRWEWRNEFTGDVHGGDERYARLMDLASGGASATDWFKSTALPAILGGMR